MSQATHASSPRRAELLELSYQHVLAHGLTDMSLRPLARAVGSSTRVLLYLFGSKDDLVRALLGRARQDELALLATVRRGEGNLGEIAVSLWEWLAAPEHRNVLTLWMEAYTRSLVDPQGAWAGFAEQTVRDWLELLADLQPATERDSPVAVAERTTVLAILRGALLDLLATGDTHRTTAAVQHELTRLQPSS